jgi:hypothetical protein
MRMKDALPIVFPAMRSFLFIAAGLLFAACGGKTLEQGAAYWPVLCIFVNLVTIASLFAISSWEKKPFRDLIAAQPKRWKASEILRISILMILVGMGGMLACSFALYGGMPEFLIQPLPLPWAIVSLVFLPLTIVFAELPLYFGYAYNRLTELTRWPWIAGVYVIFWYALQHSFFPLILEERYMMFRFLAFLPLMILILILYRRNRSLVPLMVGHGIMDLGTGIQILIVSLSA